MTDPTVTAETTDLTVIDGVGSAVRDSLRDAGFETVGDVSDATIDDFDPIDGVGETSAQNIIDHATELSAEDSSDETDSESAPDLAALEEPFIIDDVDGIEFTLDIDADIFPYVLHVVLEEAVSQQQSNSFGLRDEAFACFSALQHAQLSQGGPTYQFVATESAITTLYRALKRGAADYQNRNGITSRYATLRSLADQLNEYR